ncbi:MAG TPA: hypothetical protein VK541_09430 [Pedobacter sp.]|uniref:hypothetical protein n=1 Tax=Pedobacter sp. TaxID=1411316 RepID=UPI002D173CE3|nr:hypothetical protein [Pedobacter sp.]HMI02691.1 hypothetical protein [Pedobacter sp.]
MLGLLAFMFIQYRTIKWKLKNIGLKSHNFISVLITEKMKFKTTVYLLLIFQLLVFGCNNKPDNQNSADNLDAMKKDTVAIQSLSSNVVDQGAVSPFKEVDSIIQLLNKKFVVADLRKLDGICSRSDGDLSEYLDAVAVDLLNDHLDGFLEYLQRNPESCLKRRLSNGLAGNCSVYEKSERPRKLKEEQDRLVSIAKIKKLDVGKIKFLNEIFNKVDPNLLD